jgi:hypothetical protein
VHFEKLPHVVVYRKVLVGNERKGFHVLLLDFLPHVRFQIGEILVPLHILVRIFRVLGLRLPGSLPRTGVLRTDFFRFLVESLDHRHAVVYGFSDSLEGTVHTLPAFTAVVGVEISGHAFGSAGRKPLSGEFLAEKVFFDAVVFLVVSLEKRPSVFPILGSGLHVVTEFSDAVDGFFHLFEERIVARSIAGFDSLRSVGLFYFLKEARRYEDEVVNFCRFVSEYRFAV